MSYDEYVFLRATDVKDSVEFYKLENSSLLNDVPIMDFTPVLRLESEPLPAKPHYSKGTHRRRKRSSRIYRHAVSDNIHAALNHSEGRRR
jgi:hypothetical protein